METREESETRIWNRQRTESARTSLETRAKSLFWSDNNLIYCLFVRTERNAREIC